MRKPIIGTPIGKPMAHEVEDPRSLVSAIADAFEFAAINAPPGATDFCMSFPLITLADTGEYIRELLRLDAQANLH